MFSNKRGIELSINFIVMLVLAIAVFAGGLVFASKFFGHAEKVRGNLESQTERQIEKLLDSGSPVVMPISTKEVFRNKFETFGLGVLARFSGKYTVSIDFDQAFKKDKSQITNIYAQDWIQLPTSEMVLQKNEKGKFLIGIQVPDDAEKGTYIFKVKVSYEDLENPTNNIDEYDNPLQMIVKVP
ncbi:hypothetical protein KY349_01800 [Candidatus Woesearchaeota archaeon]|nr:hypothetical protein [Candidatus Woesearchaeota archaeon]